MILCGIVHTSLGGFTVIRGVAPLGELARCSEFDPEYQRNLIEQHRSEIERFLDDSNYLFFPEVILSALLRVSPTSGRGGETPKPAYDILYGKGFKSSVNGLEVSTVKSRLPKKMQVVGGPEAPRIAYLNIPEEALENGEKLFRIDGNHRLSAAAEVSRDNPRYKLPAPFCVVLQDNTAQAQRWDKVVFHNINSKQIPLTSEENLSLILNPDRANEFSDRNLIKGQEFGPAYYLARKLQAVIDSPYLEGLRRAFRSPYSLALALTEFLIAQNVIAVSNNMDQLNLQLPRFKDALKSVNATYESHTLLAENACHGLLISFLFFAMSDEGRHLKSFTRWVLQNRIHYLAPSGNLYGTGYHFQHQTVQAVDAASLVSVFQSVLQAKSRTIFVAMAFDKSTERTFETIKKTVDQINDKYRLEVELETIRIDKLNKGHSYTINEEILDVIESAGLLIADLTLGNRNVYHEIGYLMGLNRGKGQPHNNFILIADSSRGDELEKDVAFNLKPWQQLRFDSTIDLEKRLGAALMTYYQLA